MILYECPVCQIRLDHKPARMECPNCGEGLRVMVPCDCHHYEYPSLVRIVGERDMCLQCYENLRKTQRDLQEVP